MVKIVLRKSIGKTRWQVADETGLSMSTIDHHTKRLTKFPRAISLQMYLRAYGYKIQIVPI